MSHLSGHVKVHPAMWKELQEARATDQSRIYQLEAENAALKATVERLTRLHVLKSEAIGDLKSEISRHADNCAATKTMPHVWPEWKATCGAEPIRGRHAVEVIVDDPHNITAWEEP